METGFGYIWRNQNSIKDRLGWAIAPEIGYTSDYIYDYRNVIDKYGSYLGGMGQRTLADEIGNRIIVYDDGSWSN